jgi:hypothetical protein
MNEDTEQPRNDRNEVKQPQFQFVEPDRVVELFLHCVGQLRVDDDGLASGHDVAELNAVAYLCLMMKTLAIVPRDPLDILLFELADATEALITTAVLPPNGDVVGRWTNARVSVMNCRLGAIE